MRPYLIARLSFWESDTRKNWNKTNQIKKLRRQKILRENSSSGGAKNEEVMTTLTIVAELVRAGLKGKDG